MERLVFLLTPSNSLYGSMLEDYPYRLFAEDRGFSLTESGDKVYYIHGKDTSALEAERGIAILEFNSNC